MGDALRVRRKELISANAVLSDIIGVHASCITQTRQCWMKTFGMHIKIFSGEGKQVGQATWRSPLTSVQCNHERLPFRSVRSTSRHLMSSSWVGCRCCKLLQFFGSHRPPFAAAEQNKGSKSKLRAGNVFSLDGTMPCTHSTWHKGG